MEFTNKISHITSQKVVRIHSVKLKNLGINLQSYKILQHTIPVNIQKSFVFLYTNNNQKQKLRKSHLLLHPKE